jgi:polyphosphate kinase
VKEKFFNRELAWLGFDGQVLEEALDLEVPLLERLKFLSIVSNNLDEFFMVRVAELKRKEREGSRSRCPAGMTPAEQLAAISGHAHDLVRRTYDCAVGEVLPRLAKKGIRLHAWPELGESEQDYLSRVFHNEVHPVLTPLAIAPDRPFPVLPNLCLNLGVLLEPGKGETDLRLAIVLLPPRLPRFIRLPDTGSHDYVLLEDVVRHHLGQLFEGQKILDKVVFRITRDSELDPDGDAATWITEIEEELRKRRTNLPVRLEVEQSIEKGFLDILKRRIGLEDPDIYLIPGPLDLKAFFELTDLQGFDNLHYEPYPPQPLVELDEAEDIWSLIRKKDILLYHPYDSFDPVVQMLRSAASDSGVLAIKQTLYRTSRDSPIIEALIEAAQNGKHVCVLVELMARFDEERNIEGARRLEDAGAHVIWGIVGLKIHAKICLIVRREPQGIRRYVHLGTGNYNERTARLYTDYGLLTADENIGVDASSFFNALTGFSDVPKFQHLVMAPYQLREKLKALVLREAKIAQGGQPGRITLKMNSLVDPKLIEALYKASQAGVQVLANVRGICCLRPGVPGLSENIRVVSIIDRFLEHPRVYHFRNGGNDEVYLSSADWMPRNLDRRVELLFPLLDAEVRQRLIASLAVYFEDNRSARVLQPDGVYVRRKPGPGELELRTQGFLHQNAVRERERKTGRPPTQLVPRDRRVARKGRSPKA